MGPAFVGVSEYAAKGQPITVDGGEDPSSDSAMKQIGGWDYDDKNSVKPSASSPWTADIGVKGYVGDRLGAAGSISVLYAF